MLTINSALSQLEAKGFTIKAQQNGLRYAEKDGVMVAFCLWNSTTLAVQTTRIYRPHGRDLYLTAIGLAKWIAAL